MIDIRKYILYLLTILVLIIPSNVLAFTGINYRSFSGLDEVDKITESEIDHTKSVFVSEMGSDDNNGSISSPFKTINKAIASIEEDYTIYVRNGTYNEVVVIDKGNITLRNYPGEVAKITGVNIPNSNANIIINPNLSNITIYGLYIQDRNESTIEAAFGIFVHGGVRNLIIQNNNFTNLNGNVSYKDSGGYNAGGIVIYGNQERASKNILITGNKLYNMDCGRSEAITLTGYVAEADIIENEINDIVNIGIDVAGGYKANSNPDYDYARNIYVAGNKVDNAVSTIAYNGGIYVDGAQGVLVERNMVTNCPYGISIDQEVYVSDEKYTAQNIIVSSNYFINNTIGGIRLGGSKGANTSVINSTVINNTAIHSPGAGSSVLVLGKSKNNNIVNNVFVDNGTWNNLIYTDDNSTEDDLININIYNNYLYHAHREGFGKKYFVFGATQYTESEFKDLPTVKDNIIGENVNLNSDNSVVAGSTLDGIGLITEYSSILRDYNGYLREEPLDLGYITNKRKVDTEEDLNKLKSKFAFENDYTVIDPVINNPEPDDSENNEVDNNQNNDQNNGVDNNQNNDQNNEVDDNQSTDQNNEVDDNQNDQIDDNTEQIDSSNEVINNPKTGDNIEFYIILLIVSLIGLIILFTKKKVLK